MKKILVVDDDESILDVMDVLLVQNGYAVITTSTFEFVIELVERELPDLIILDIMVNGENGRNICKILKENKLTQKIPIILFSASDSKLKNYQECKADGILEKPFDLSKLLKVIRSTIKMVSFLSFVKYIN